MTNTHAVVKADRRALTLIYHYLISLGQEFITYELLKLYQASCQKQGQQFIGKVGLETVGFVYDLVAVLCT